MKTYNAGDGVIITDYGIILGEVLNVDEDGNCLLDMSDLPEIPVDIYIKKNKIIG